MSLPPIVIEDTRPPKPCQKFKGHASSVWDVIHLPDGQQIMTCSDDGSLGVWNLQSGKRIANWQDGKSAVYSIALSVDGKTVVSGSEDGAVRLWNMETGKILATWIGHRGPVLSVCWNRDGERVLSGSWGGTTRVWDVETRNTILKINTGLQRVYTATFSPDSTLIATGGIDSGGERIKIWDANTGKLISILKGHRWRVNCLAWTANGRTLISGSLDKTIRTWNTSTWQQLAVFTGHTGSVHGIAISLNGLILASASWNHTARLWNLENGQTIGSPIQHRTEVNCLSFSTDGKILATSCIDHNAYTWDISPIIEDAGLIDLLSLHQLNAPCQDGEKSFLDADATPHPIRESENACQLPEGFFAESPSHSNADVPLPISPLVVPEDPCPTPPPAVSEDAQSGVQLSSPERARPGFFNWHRRDTPVTSSFLQRVRVPFFKRPQRMDNEVMELQERPPSIVDVPLGYGKPRYYSTAQERLREKREREEKEKEKARIAKKSKDAKHASTSSRPRPLSNITQQPTDQSEVQPSSEPHPAPPTPPAAPVRPTPAPATVSATPAPATFTIQAGCWIRFSLCIGCVSVAHPSGHY